MNNLYLLFIALTCFIACRIESKSKETASPAIQHPVIPEQIDYDTTLWTELTSSDGYVIDIKYATTDNFVKEAVYPCGRCFLKPAVASGLAEVRDKLKDQGYKLILFDCYRPRPVQYKLWKKVPNPDYVANPAEGSMHNRGVAIDLGLADMSGKELDMGTPYDFFGPEAHHDYTRHPEKVLNLRTLLKSSMETHGFQSVRTEWWHYSFTSGSYPLADWQWSCN